MERMSPDARPAERTLGRKIRAFVIATLIVAALGALIGWLAGEILIGALFGLAIGLFAASRSGHVMSEPNQERPPWDSPV